MATRGQQSVKYRLLDPEQKRSMTDMSHTAKQKTEKPHSPSTAERRRLIEISNKLEDKISFRVQNDKKKKYPVLAP